MRLWPHHPNPPESLALPEVIGVQIAAAALLFPVAFTDGATLLVNLALIAPMQQLAGLLSAAPQRQIWVSTAFVALWVAGLGGWAKLARSELSRTGAVCLATLLTLGWVLLGYARAEAMAQLGRPPPNLFWFGPLAAAVAQATLSAHVNASWVWVVDAVPLLSSAWVLGRLNRRWKPRRRHITPTPRP